MTCPGDYMRLIKEQARVDMWHTIRCLGTIGRSKLAIQERG